MRPRHSSEDAGKRASSPRSGRAGFGAMLPAATTLAAAALLVLGTDGAIAQDTDLFRTNVPPNIMLVVDNSKSMSNTVWHPSFKSPDDDQSQCRHFRDLSSSKFRIYTDVQEANLYNPDGTKTKTRGAGNEKAWEPPIRDYDGVQVYIDGNGNSSMDSGEGLFHRACNPETSDADNCVGNPELVDYDGTKLTYKGLQLYKKGTGGSVKVPTRITPREDAVASGINPETLYFLPGTTICNAGTISTSWKLWEGDPDAEIPSGSTIQHRYQYLDYLFSDVGASARTQAFAPTESNGGLRQFSPCLNRAGTFEAYRRTRLTALQLILETVVCEVNQDNIVRFGLSQFRYRGTGSEANINGGYAVLPINDFYESDGTTEKKYTLHGAERTHGEHLANVISKVGPDSATPLAETLFQVYTYFMSRKADDMPVGRAADGTLNSTKFPVYSYDASQPDDSDPKVLDLVGGYYLGLTGDGDAHADAPASPVLWSCQKNFVLFITDGGSHKDVFDVEVPTDTGQGFSDFATLIGDHYLVGGTADETEVVSSDKTLYLDDIAYFMNRWDFRPDLEGDQTIDTYTVGYAMDPAEGGAANLQKAALNGNGLYFESSDADQLTADIVKAINDMIDKAQAFTSATVPAARTTDGNSFFSSYFRPITETPFWEGHLKNFTFTIGGDILTKTGKCAVGTDIAATPPCNGSGTLRTTAEANWDAADHIPDPAARKLWYGYPKSTSMFSQPQDWDNVTKTVLDLEPSDLVPVPYNEATGADDDAKLTELAGLIENNIKGCQWNTDCTTRVDADGKKALLGDIFHSNPVVVGSPNSAINETTYKEFRAAHKTRDRVIYAGANDGFLHAFNAGTWDTNLSPERHNQGTGVELFGFMPRYITKTIKNLRIDSTVPRNYLAVDGSPISSDVWMYRRDLGSGNLGSVDPTLTNEAKTLAQWRTVLIGGLRDGGNSYYALDVTNPASSSYPGYLWEFPCGVQTPATGQVDDCDGAANPSSQYWEKFMGETWAEPVITRVRVAVSGSTDPSGHERWVAIFGAGYDKGGDPNDPSYIHDADEDDDGEVRGRGIFMVDITTGEVLAAKVFTKTAVTESGGVQVGFPEMRYAIASSPAVYDLNFDGLADVIYIGDLGGNVWRWVIDDVGGDSINGGGMISQPDWPFRLYFRAAASTEPPTFPTSTTHFQSFFFPPTGVLRNSSQLVLSMGSGERANAKKWESDGVTTNNNRYFVFKDGDPLDRRYPTNHASYPDPLTGYLADSLLKDIDTFAGTCSDLQAGPGFYVIGRDAEKFITNSVVFLGNILTGSFLPSDPTASDLCEKGGSAYLYVFGVDCSGGVFTPSAGYSANTSASDQRRKAIGGGIPTRPRISIGNINQNGGGNANRVVMITSDAGMENASQGSTSSSGINLRTWLER